MNKISVVVNTLNEEKNLPKCLASVRTLADEVVVLDMNSDDGTREIAKAAGAKVYLHKRTGYVEPARNFAIRKARGKYILVLDADEMVPGELAQKLREIAEDENSADYYRIPRKNIIFGKWMKHTGWWPDYNIRFFKKGSVVWNEIIHSVPKTKGRGVDLEPKEGYAILHYNYQTIEQYIERKNRYTSIQADELIRRNYKFIWPDLIRKPTGEFLRRYFAESGFKDSAHGLALSLLQAFSELSLYLKVWQKEKFKEQYIPLPDVVRQIKDTERDINYWLAESLIRQGAGLKERIKRKFRLR